ncbi:MAG: hypothetical protein R3C14_55290 [Caldilineaceae bacterium]
MTNGSNERLILVNNYDSFGNLARQAENGVNRDFPYDMQNRLLTGYGQSYTYDSVGRLTSYENTGQTMNASFPAHAIKNSGYTYDNNGNMTGRSGKTLDWDHENHLQQVKNGSTVLESYNYDADGVRIKKIVGSTATYYPNQYYEQPGSTSIKYYYFNGQRVAMRQLGVLTYLHSDHLGSTVLETNSSGGLSTDEWNSCAEDKPMDWFCSKCLPMVLRYASAFLRRTG